MQDQPLPISYRRNQNVRNCALKPNMNIFTYYFVEHIKKNTGRKEADALRLH